MGYRLLEKIVSKSHESGDNSCHKVIFQVFVKEDSGVLGIESRGSKIEHKLWKWKWKKEKYYDSTLYIVIGVKYHSDMKTQVCGNEC